MQTQWLLFYQAPVKICWYSWGNFFLLNMIHLFCLVAALLLLKNHLMTAIFLSSLIHITFARTKTLALQALFIMHYFEMEVMVYNVHISQIMIYKALLWTDVFWISYIKWYIFYNNNLLFFFNITVKQSLLSLLQHNSKNKKFLSFFFAAFVFRMGSLPMCLQREHIG